MTKFYVHDEEVQITIQEDTKGKIRWCQSPLHPASNYPSCHKGFYTAEYEEAVGVIKHVPGVGHKYTRPKAGTMVSCWELPLNHCQKLVDVNMMECPHCHRKIDYEGSDL